MRPVGADDDFFALGGDSLAAAEIIASLEHETGTSLPVSVLTGSPTVAGLAEALRIAPPSAQSPLVVLRAGGDRAPLVLVHGNAGNLLHYSDLVPLLDRDRPVWGLEHTETDDLSLEAIAAREAQALTEANPSGPFLLIGFCFGAVVAHEIACRLRAEGHEVPLLALLGITPSEFAVLLPPRVLDRWREAPPSPSPGLLAQIRNHVEKAWARPIRERPRYLARRGVNVANRTRRRIGLGSSRPVSPYEALQRALAAHRPATYGGTALVVLHEDETAAYTDDPGRDWAALAEHVDLEVLPGAEHSMLELPGVARLGELLDLRLAPLLR